jgi:hypothetical protein
VELYHEEIAYPITFFEWKQYTRTNRDRKSNSEQNKREASLLLFHLNTINTTTGFVLKDKGGLFIGDTTISRGTYPTM